MNEEEAIVEPSDVRLARIRELIERVSSSPGISPEFSLLSVADSKFLLDKLKEAGELLAEVRENARLR